MFTAKCDDCGNDIKISEDTIQEKPLDKDITATYFTCPKCNRVYIVQLDNLETKQMFEEIRELAASCAGKTHIGDKIQKRMNNKALKLKQKRAELKKKFPSIITELTLINRSNKN